MGNLNFIRSEFRKSACERAIEDFTAGGFPDLWYKFGVQPDADSGDGQINVWDLPLNKTYRWTPIGTKISQICSSALSDAGKTIQVYGLQYNDSPLGWVRSYQEVILHPTDGRIPVDLDDAGNTYHPLSRSFRLFPAATNRIDGDIYLFEEGVTNTLGVPDELDKVTSYIDELKGQTQQLTISVPADEIMVVYDAGLYIGKKAVSGSVLFSIEGGSPFDDLSIQAPPISLSINASTAFVRDFIKKPIVAPGLSDVQFLCDSDTNDMVVSADMILEFFPNPRV